MPQKKERSYPLSAIMAALDDAALTRVQQQTFLAALERRRPKRGHPLTNDYGLQAQALKLTAQGLGAYSAAKRVTESLPDSERDAAFKRVYRKTKATVKELAGKATQRPRSKDQERMEIHRQGKKGAR